MEVNGDVSTGLKVYIMFFIILIVVMLTVFVFRQNRDLDILYTSVDSSQSY